MRIVIGLVSLASFFCPAQNLVPNSGFEEFQKCPNGHSEYGKPMYIPNWFSPSRGTPDYFNECSPFISKCGINWAGRCEVFSGSAYSGIITYLYLRTYREYLSVELLQQLDSGVKYSVQFSFRLSSYSRVSTGNIGLAFTSSRPAANDDGVLPLNPCPVAMPDSAIVSKTGSWQVANGDYQAKGGERFLTIGNFSKSNSIYRIKSGGNHEAMLANASYYYIDDVMVQAQPAFVPIETIAIEDENLFESDSLIVLKNVQFAYNSSSLDEISKIELDRLCGFMRNNLQAQIEIYGHTDDQGSDEYNLQLSLLRAKSVAGYLSTQSIDTSRVKYFGFGKSKPLIDSTDEPARSINRRVEVRLVP